MGVFLGGLTYAGATLLKMTQIHLNCSHFSDITKDVVVAARESASVCVCVLLLEARSLLSLNQQEMENGLLFLKLVLRSDTLMQLCSVQSFNVTAQGAFTDFCSTIAKKQTKSKLTVEKSG